MAVSKTKVIDGDVLIGTWTDTAGGGTASGMYVGGYPYLTVQRVSGTGTYTVLGSNDGTNYAALNTAISAKATDVVTPIIENPLFLRVDIAAAAAVVIVVGSK